MIASPAVRGRELKQHQSSGSPPCFASPAVRGRELKRALPVAPAVATASPAVRGRELKHISHEGVSLRVCRPPCAGVN